MAAVTYKCQVDPACPVSAQPGFCDRHPTSRLVRERPTFTAPPPEPPAQAADPAESQPGDQAPRPTRPMLCLRLLAESVPIPVEGIEIGRDSPHFANLPGFAALTQVSRCHARLSYAGEELLVRDLASTNGTYVDGVKIDGPALIRPGQTLRLGRDVEIEIAVTRLDQYGLPE